MRTRTRTRRAIALVTAAVLAGSLLEATATPPARADDLPGVPAAERALSGHGVPMRPRTGDGQPRTPQAPPRRAWPPAATATVNLHGSAAPGRAGDLPVSLATPVADSAPPFAGAATVRVFDRDATRRAGVPGVLLSVTPGPGSTGGAADIAVDYSAFAGAFGGGYGTRLRLVRLPACAATTPERPGCTAAIPTDTRHDEDRHTLTARSVALPGDGAPPVVLAVTAGTSGSHGDFTATSLSPSATWRTNLNTGDFSWSYDLPVPNVPGDFAPKLSVSYSSAALDGRTTTANNQSSWLGDGFDLWPGYIERRYKPCSDDGVTTGGEKPGDLCWAYDNATLSFNGKAGELIPAGGGTWKVKGDDGTRVERLTGSGRDNGDDNQEHWKVTTTDGTRYFFGYHKLPGWASGKDTTDSTWSVPVFGDDSGEPCHAATFADSWCQQAWRWNLDYAVDPQGNAIAYYYEKESNRYGRNRKPADETVYDRGGYLDRIEYGLRDDAVYSVEPLATVDLTSAERCLPTDGVTCAADTIDDKAFYWYDTPWDTHCAADKDCYTIAPTFWTRKRLTKVTSKVRIGAGNYSPVDEWAFDHRWGTADIDYQLLLRSIAHTGRSATPAITLPKVTFAYDQRPNRLDRADDDTAPFIKERLASVADEYGGQLDVRYSTADCDGNNLPTPQRNTTRCYPLFYTADGEENPSRQWFNKYVVTSVTRTDRTRSSPDMVTWYDYLDGGAWHYDDDDGLTKEKYKTWSTWRGYGHVRVRTGGQSGAQAQADHYFLRGMNGDRAGPDGGTTTVTVPDGEGGTLTDDGANGGFEYRTEQYSGPAGRILGKTVNTPWHHETARRVRSWGTTTANLTGTASTRTWTSLDDGAGGRWRQTRQNTTFETTAGRITRTEDLADTATAADDQCTRTSYAENTGVWILTTQSRVETVAVACAATPDRSKDVLADTRTAYDGGGYGAAPTAGLPTRVATLSAHDGTTATYLEAALGYDSYGRQVTATDITATVTATESTAPVRSARGDGRTTTTTYTPATGLPTGTKVTGPPATPGSAATAQTTTTTYDPVRGQATAVVDANGKRTDTTFDALGRSLRAWQPDRSKAAGDIPSAEFTYTVAENAPAAVGVRTLRSGSTQWTSYTIYDGFLRPRQTQAPGPGGGRLLTDTFYDGRGLVAKSFAPYYNTSPPGTGLLVLDDALAVETQTWNTYDGLGRVVESRQVAGNGDGGRVLATTRTEYAGDRTTVTPPVGGTPTTSVTDARGNTVELLQYKAAAPTGAADTTRYTYTPAGKLAKIVDPAGNAWTYEYDQRGNRVLANDPDKGQSRSSYDDRNQLVATTDARGRKVTVRYDGQGRETETYDGDTNGTLLTRQVWDPAGAKGQLASATRYVGGAAGAAYTTTVNSYDELYRPLRTTVTIPMAEGAALAGSYQANIRYNANGTVQSTTYPAAGALAAETVVPGYDDALRPVTLTGNGGVTYTTGVAYSYTGKPLQLTYASGGKKTQVTNTYEWGTQRLSTTRVDREDVPGVDRSATYTYDQSGTVLAIADVSRDGTDNQCFRYDYLGRLAEAWAQRTTTCAAAPAATALGGPAPYWQSFTYDTTGNRLTDTRHDPAGDTTKDVRHTYTYPAVKAARPHALTRVQTTGPTGTAVDDYGYDPAGNTATRTRAGDQQRLDWDAEGHLSTVTEPDGGTTSYLYDADGTRLIRRTASETTLYLGATEITLAKGATTATARRYYDVGGGNAAVRTNDNTVTFLLGDHHGTSEFAVRASDLSVRQRRSTPFGAPRGPQPTGWPSERGFVGGTQDASTGLTHLGVREYDPDTGRFISVDPVLDPTDPQQLNAYAYAGNNPVTKSDPSGLMACNDPRECGGGIQGGNSDASRSGIPLNDPVWGCPGCDGDSYHVGPPPKIGGSGGRGSGGGRQPERDWFPDWLAHHSPKTNNPDHLHAAFGNYGVMGYGNDYWESPTGWGEACFGWLGCRKAYEYLGHHHDDVAGAKRIAATYCLEHFKECVNDSGQVASSQEALNSLVLGLTGGLAGPIGRICHSFPPDTEVLLGNGARKKIDDVRVGDAVLTTDPETGRTTARKVVATIVTEDDKDFADITLSGGDGNDAILATTTHPFWVVGAHAWVKAGDLVPGMLLRTADGATRVVRDVRVFTRHQRTNDLTVDRVHTYYVLAGDTPVLVHNCTPNLQTRNNMAATGMRPGRNGKAETSQAGMEYDKHQLSPGQESPKRFLPRVGGNKAALDRAGQTLLDDITFHPRGVEEPLTGGGFTGGTRIIRPDGVGAVFDADGVFRYFGNFTYPG